MNMTRKQIGPTVIQDIALNLVFSVMGERRINRTQQEYAAIAAKLPPLKVLSFKVNQLLQSIHQESARSETPLPQLSTLFFLPEPYKLDSSILRKRLENCASYIIGGMKGGDRT